jgi:glycerol uptake facilitator-like aquaporin
MYEYLAEFIGSTFFIYIILATNNVLAIGAAFALILLILTRFSSGYLNPAITITLAAAGKYPPSDIIPYSVAQILGGLVALEIFKRWGV